MCEINPRNRYSVGRREGTTTAEATFGDRVRALRIEKGLKGRELGALMPEPRHFTWVSKIEKNQQEPSLADLVGLAGALDIDVRWLLTGDTSGMTEFIATMSEVETHLDARAIRLVLSVARQQVEELRDYPQ